MSTLRVDNIKSRTGTAVTIPSGQSLDVTGDLNVTGDSSFNTTGIITAGQFKTTAGVGITENIVAGVITATTFKGTLDGAATGLSGTPDITVQNITGVAATFTGVLTYEDVTNVDSVGMVTARGGLEIGAAGVGGTITSVGNAILSGITTVGTGLSFGDNVKACFGAAGDLQIYHDGSHSFIKDAGTGNLRLGANDLRIQTDDFAENYILGTKNGAISIYYDNSVKLATTDTGVTVTGQLVGVTTGGTASGCSVGVGTTGTILQVTDGATQNSFAGVLVEKASIVATNVTNAVGTIDLAQGNVHYFTTNGSGASTADIIYKGGNNLSSFMKVGDNISVSLITKPNNSEYINAVTIDGAAVTEEWGGGTTPSSASGAASSYTITSINITRFAATGTPNSDYLVLVSVNNYA